MSSPQWVKSLLGRGYSCLPVRIRRRSRYGEFLRQPPTVGKMQIKNDLVWYPHYAGRLMAGKWSIFALDEIDLGFPPRWNRDPLTGKQAPMTLGKTIDCRDEQLVGNIKYPSARSAQPGLEGDRQRNPLASAGDPPALPGTQ